MELTINIQQTALLVMGIISLIAWADRELNYVKLWAQKLFLVMFGLSFVALIVTTSIRIWVS
jgi:hypothetical protein